jgi:hypothetical protein
MRANVELHVQFRSSPEDAAAFAYMLPQEQKGEAARRELINSLARLPQRHCYLAVRDLGLRAQLVLAPRIDFDALRVCGRRVSPELRQRIQRGIASLPREEVLRQMSAESPVPMKPEVNDPPAMPVAKDDESFQALG